MTNVAFAPGHLQAIAQALTDTERGLTHRDVTYFLRVHGMEDKSPNNPRWERVFNGFVDSLNRSQSTKGVIAFIESATNPARFFNNRNAFESLRESLNKPLALVGLAVSTSGKVSESTRVSTLPEAERRARELRDDLRLRGVHPDVLKFCRSELLVDNYFHAVLEATKSVADKLRSRTGLLDDGAILVNHVYGGEKPLLALNSLRTKSERDEQKGFCNLLIGIFGMFRNPTAHEARINWHMSKEDAEDLLSLVSLVHRRIDGCVMPPRM